MKYEITKGSEKDFEDAPESATVRIIESGFEDRFPIFADKFENYSTRTHCATGVYDSCIADVSNWSIIAERRPITEPVVNQQLTTEWDGAGIAHLGQHVEYFWGEGKEWRKAEVVAHYEEWPLLKDIEDGLMVAELNNKMRPIRSPEDVARDEEIVLLTDVICGKMPDVGMATAAMFAGRVYDAGYRRPKPHVVEVQACEHKSTRPSAGGCICNDCGWRSW